MDLNKIINNTLAEIQHEGFVEQVVKKRVQETITKIVDDVFGTWGDFKKNLEKEVESSLKVNFSELGLSGYNQLVLSTVKESLDQALHIQGVEKMKERMDDLLSNAKPEYKLSELIKEFKESVNEDHEYDDEEISFHVRNLSHIIFIDFDKESDKGEHSCEYGITVSKESGTVSNVRLRSDYRPDREMDKKNILGGFYGFEDTLFKMFAAGSKLIVDEEAVDMYYESND
ncbi:hypothetical protein [Paenibacillus sp. NRS-1780]|uniref:hypothetical protein n=1 Tax=Paenibacillus sp. NRS-1780 TaxID=3233904 RepID=UPI003D2D907A